MIYYKYCLKNDKEMATNWLRLCPSILLNLHKKKKHVQCHDEMQLKYDIDWILKVVVLVDGMLRRWTQQSIKSNRR